MDTLKNNKEDKLEEIKDKVLGIIEKDEKFKNCDKNGDIKYMDALQIIRNVSKKEKNDTIV